MPLSQSIALLEEQMAHRAPTPETMKLLRAIWPKAEKAVRLQLLSNLGDPPSPEVIETWRDDDDLHTHLLRQWRWLVGVSEDLPEPWHSAHQHLASTFGTGDPDARLYRIESFSGSVSLLSAQEISELGPRRFAEWAAAWAPPPHGWRAPTPAGLADELMKAVHSSPEVWNNALPDIVETLRHPTYIRGILDALREPARVGVSIYWDRLVPTFDLIVSEPWEVPRIAENNFEADLNWTECIRVVIWLIQEALDRDTPFEDAILDRFWLILLAAMRKRNGGPATSSRKLLDTAINKMSTRALQAMFSLALSVSRRGGDSAPWSERLAEAVGEELASDEVEAELAGAVVASLFAQFVHVCGTRANDFVPRLMGSPTPHDVKADVLETLLLFAQPITNEMLGLFMPYIVAYFHVERGDDDKEIREAARWLMIGYIRQLKNQNDPRMLVTLLALPSRISEGAEFFGRALRERTEPDPRLAEVGLRFWDELLNTSELEAEAFQGFGWWSEGNAIDDQAWLQRMYATLQRTEGRIDWADEVVQRLIRLGHYAEAWKALSLLVQGAPDQWTVAYWARNLHGLFESSNDADGDVQTLRIELAERLLEKELLDFRQYLTTGPQLRVQSS